MYRRACRACSPIRGRSEEHTSELQSHVNLVCRLLLEKKNHTDYFWCSTCIECGDLLYALHSRVVHLDLHSFPTRRSSDLSRRTRSRSCPAASGSRRSSPPH